MGLRMNRGTGPRRAPTWCRRGKRRPWPVAVALVTAACGVGEAPDGGSRYLRLEEIARYGSMDGDGTSFTIEQSGSVDRGFVDGIRGALTERRFYLSVTAVEGRLRRLRLGQA